MVNSKFTEEERLSAVELYKDGHTVKEVESLTGISSEYVKDLLKKYNIKARPSGFQNGNLNRSGKSHSELSKKKISSSHKKSGHKPSQEAIDKGQPQTLIVRWKGHKKDPVSQLIKSYTQGALRRKLSFLLSQEEFELIILKTCYYCGVSPSLRKINGCDLVCNGIDRVDNSLGYFKENCVPACKICNVMKSSKNSDEFINHCLSIAERFKNGK